MTWSTYERLNLKGFLLSVSFIILSGKAPFWWKKCEKKICIRNRNGHIIKTTSPILYVTLCKTT